MNGLVYVYAVEVGRSWTELMAEFEGVPSTSEGVRIYSFLPGESISFWFEPFKFQRAHCIRFIDKRKDPSSTVRLEWTLRPFVLCRLGTESDSSFRFSVRR